MTNALIFNNMYVYAISIYSIHPMQLITVTTDKWREPPSSKTHPIATKLDWCITIVLYK